MASPVFGPAKPRFRITRKHGHGKTLPLPVRRPGVGRSVMLWQDLCHLQKEHPANCVIAALAWIFDVGTVPNGWIVAMVAMFPEARGAKTVAKKGVMQGKWSSGKYDTKYRTFAIPARTAPVS